MRMFSSSANCARMPPADFDVEPDASTSRSTRTTSSTPNRRRWKAVAAPRAPPPITTTSAVLLDAAQHGAGRLPVAARPLDHLELLEREGVVLPGLLDEPLGQERVRPRVQVLDRLHERGAGRVLPGLAERVGERPRDPQPVADVRVAVVEARH